MLSSHTNPILADIRENIGHATYARMLEAVDDAWYFSGHFVTKEWERIDDPDVFDHARRVLARLAALS